MKPHWILLPFSLLYGMAVAVRNLLFDAGILRVTDVGIPVISIGNITAGGSGKTPLAIETARLLSGLGKKVAVISRGYGRSTKGTVTVSDGKELLCGVSAGGDEPVMIASLVKEAIVVADEDRVRGARFAIKKFGADCIVLDDGFQHRYLKRTCDIVLLDSTRSPFETMLLPAGYRREMLRSLRRADAVVVTKVTDGAVAVGIGERREIKGVRRRFSSTYQPAAVQNIFTGIRQSLEMLKGHSILAVSGIANAEGFHRALTENGAVIASVFSQGDHHRYTKEEIDSMVNVFHQRRYDFVVTTEKDAVKLKTFPAEWTGVPILSLVMEVRIDRNDEWQSMVKEAAA